MTLLPFMGIFATLILIVAGHIVRWKLKNQQDRPRAKSLATMFLVIGYSSLIIILGVVGVTYWAIQGINQTLGKNSAAPFDGELNIQLLIGKISPEQVEGGTLVRFPETDHKSFQIGFYEWEYDFPGFHRTALSAEEARNVLKVFVESHPAAEPVDFSKRSKQETRAAMDQTRSELEAVLGFPKDNPSAPRDNVSIYTNGISFGLYAPKGQVHDGVVEFHLPRGKRAYARILQAPNGVFLYVPARAGTSMGALRGISKIPSPLLETAFNRATPSKIEVLFPTLSAERAVKRGVSEFGEIYNEVVRDIQSAPAIIAAVGPVREVRPAKGRNQASHWLDFSARFYFYVRGDKGEAAIMAVINDNDRSLDMITNNQLTTITLSR